MPGRIGRIGWLRSRAWHWDFSSTQTTTAFSGGSTYRPTTSATLAASRGSVENLNPSVPCGCRQNRRHSREIESWLAGAAQPPGPPPARPVRHPLRGQQSIRPRRHRGGQDLAHRLIGQHRPRPARPRCVLQPGQPILAGVSAKLAQDTKFWHAKRALCGFNAARVPAVTVTGLRHGPMEVLAYHSGDHVHDVVPVVAEAAQAAEPSAMSRAGRQPATDSRRPGAWLCAASGWTARHHNHLFIAPQRIFEFGVLRLDQEREFVLVAGIQQFEVESLVGAVP